MSKSKKKIIAILITVVIISVIAFFTISYLVEKSKIAKVSEIYSHDNVEERIDTADSLDDLLLQMDGEKVIGVVKIDKIGFEGIIYEGTEISTLDKGVGHFINSSYLNGNVALAAHNSNKFWAKLYTLEYGDKITYISFLGTKVYEVSNIEQISDTDWSKINQKTEENLITLITCVKGKGSQRLMVQGIEVK